MDWYSKLTTAQRDILSEMGYTYLPSDHNPITSALKSGDFLERYGHLKIARNRTQLTRLAVICQMEVYDAQNGPEMDGRHASLREHWYRWYKVRFAQPLAIELGDKQKLNDMGVMDIDGLLWFGRLSTAYGWIVDNLDVTYKQLWVEDASRKMKRFYTELFRNANIIVAVEKDGMLKRFTVMAKALGARSIYSGKGKSGKAGIELLLREHFGWSERHNPFSEESPLVVISITDYDYDGEVVIGKTFAQQMRRYTPHVLEVRVGVTPAQVKDAGYEWPDTWYLVKMKNMSNYIDWTNQKALFWARCETCQHLWPVMSSGIHDCPECFGRSEEITLGDGTVAYGFEVEALYTKDYTGLLVNAYLSVIPFSYVVGKLRDECRADSDVASEQIKNDILKKNKSYQDLLEKLKEFDRMNEAKSNFERQVLNELDRLGEPLIDDWRDDGDDPLPEDYKRHVGDTYSYGPWCPFDQQDRTDKLVEHLEKEEAKTITAFEKQVLDWAE